MRHLVLTLVLTLAAAFAGCSSSIDTSGMEAGAMVRPTWHSTETDSGPSLDAGVRLSGPKLNLGLLPWGSPDASSGSDGSVPPLLGGGSTKDELQSKLDEQEARIADLEASGKVSAEEAAKLRQELDDARNTVDSSPTSKDEPLPVAEIIANFLAGNWILALILLAGWLFRRFLGRAVVGAGIEKVVERIKSAIDEYDKKPFEGSMGEQVTEAQIVAAVKKSETPSPTSPPPTPTA